jgi:hypothetical protein
MTVGLNRYILNFFCNTLSFDNFGHFLKLSNIFNNLRIVTLRQPKSWFENNYLNAFGFYALHNTLYA